jgi:hypothetical protein
MRVSANWSSVSSPIGARILDKLSPDAVVVFDAGGKESGELASAARQRKIPVRVVDVRRFVLPARS